ncbi:MAG: hypothetical protein ABI332_10655 [Polyangiaceae bacterium]
MLSLTNKSLIAIIGVTSAALMGVVGCSSSSDDNNPGGGNGDGGIIGNDGGPTADGSVPTDGGKDDGSTGGTTIKTGSVTYSQSNIAAAYSDFGTAAFYELPSGTDLDCAGYTTIGTPSASNAACTIKLCTVPVVPSDAGVDAGDSDAGVVVAPNTGDITLKSALQTTGVVVAAGSNGMYTTATGVTQWWAAGDATVEIKSNGSATSIPAFDNTALVGPGDLTAPMVGTTNVAIPSATPIAFDRGTDLNIAYSGGTAGTKVYVLLTTKSTAQKSIISCDFDAANGAQKIAAADLAHLEKANGTDIVGSFNLQARNVKPTTAGDYTFNVVLEANAHNGSFTNSN